MPWLDTFRISFDNLRQAKLRFVLTGLGVTIAIATLFAMLSFGAGLRAETLGSLRMQDLLRSFRVLGPEQSQYLTRVREGNSARPGNQKRLPLNDSLVERVSQLPFVESVQPDIRLPVELQNGNNRYLGWIRGALPVLGHQAPYSKISAGRFLRSRHGKEIVLSQGVAQMLGFKEVESAVGKTIELRTDQFRAVRSEDDLPIETITEKFLIVGVLPMLPASRGGTFYGGTVIPLDVARALWIRNPASTGSLTTLRGGLETREREYGLIEVRVSHPGQVEKVREVVESWGANTFSLIDEMDKLKQAFLILETIFSVLGSIALVVASLGIANVLIMSVLERMQMIGTMKAIGGTDGDIRRIFLFEAALIGLAGGVGGLIAGWLLTRLAHRIISSYFLENNMTEVPDLFAYPAWLILGVIAFALVFSVVAGLLPANRAARIDPVKALRTA
ncbi:MAG TPA: ABC transporter permease [Acidobacteriota bacterium]|nr:ABC transporter permease [Acidobacteriota bacterium]